MKTTKDKGHSISWYDMARFITPLLVGLLLFMVQDMRKDLDKIDVLSGDVAALKAQVSILMARTR